MKDSSPDCSRCSTCYVLIEPDGSVIFSHGKPGTTRRLHARVCSFVRDPKRKAACINPYDAERDGLPTSDDLYG